MAVAGAFAGGTTVMGLTGAPVPRPNVLMIPVDDLKPLLHCYGVEGILTPNIDRLATRGTVFLNNACQQAVCGPTRASLMTGLYPDSTGVWDLATRMRDVNPDVLAMPQYFIRHGYETTGVGKTYDYRCVDKKADAPSWSIPYASQKLQFSTEVPHPVRGYHHPETKAAARKGSQAIKGKSFRSGSARNRAMADAAGPMAAPATECMAVPDDAYTDGALAKAGCVLLEELARGGKPFFLSVGFLKPHLPFVAPKKYWDMYDRSKITPHRFQEHAANGPEIAYHTSGELRSYSDMPRTGDLTTEQQTELIHGYRACVSYMDAQVGRLLDKLDELGIASKTIVCLWGDHGWHLGDHAMWCKHSNFEQAVRAPLIIAAPGKAGGQKTDAPTGFVDVFPTLCELMALPIPEQLEGKSLVPLLTDPTASVRDAILSQYPRGIDGKPVMGYTLRDRRYRYVKWLQMDFRKGERSGLLVGHELYDYQTDPHETVSQAENVDYADVVARFEAVFARMGVARHTGRYTPTEAAPVVHGMGGVRLNGEGAFVSSRPVAVAGQPFEEAHEVTVSSVPDRPSMAAYKRDVMVPVVTGGKYCMSFYCRSEKGARFKAIFQRNGTPYDKLGSADVEATADWEKIAIVVEATDSHEAGGTVLTCHLGMRKQVIQFADVRIEALK